MMQRVSCALVYIALTSSCYGSQSAIATCADGAAAVEEENFERAMNIWAEESFDASAKMRLKAVLDCLASSGIAPDDESTAGWIIARADEGNVQAKLYTGLLYGSGVGVETDLDAAIDWLDRAAEKGSEAAKFIGNGLQEHVEQTRDE